MRRTKDLSKPISKRCHKGTLCSVNDTEFKIFVPIGIFGSFKIGSVEFEIRTSYGGKKKLVGRVPPSWFVDLSLDVIDESE